MKTNQVRAIYYSERKKKLKKLEDMGMLQAYQQFQKGYHNNRISYFCKIMNIDLENGKFKNDIVILEEKEK